MQYLSLEDALTQIQKLGFYVKDAGLLEGALARPAASAFGQDAYTTFELKAASLMHSVIKNHPLIDGNKRTSWALLVSFMFINGYKHNMTTSEGFDLTLGVAEGRYELDAAAAIIARHLVAR